MGKVIDILQSIVNEKQLQLDELINSNNQSSGVIAASPLDLSLAREAKLRDELALALREEEEAKKGSSIERFEGQSEPTLGGVQPGSEARMTLSKIRSKFRGLPPAGCNKHPECELPAGHDGSCHGERDYRS
jgi:hypothetical protein